MVYLTLLLRKGWKYLRRYGLCMTARKIWRCLTCKDRQILHRPVEWIPSPETLSRQRETALPGSPLISILVPLYNTPVPFLLELLKSVFAQSYTNWQLCLADGSDADHGYVETAVKRFGEKYANRIKYLRLKDNEGISENTNVCITLADGDFFALLDHDDVLSPDALFEAARAICERNADFVYTDEATFYGTPERIMVAHFKPDYAPDNLLANNYICHFTVFSRKLLEQVGPFRKKYDGSQDHDMVLRLTDAARNIVHIPKILYYWRIHAASVAMDVETKGYAVEAGKKAVSDHIRRHGRNARVESSVISPTIYRLYYELPEMPPVSIIVFGEYWVETLRGCIGSVLKYTTYPDYEILAYGDDTGESNWDEFRACGKVRFIDYVGANDCVVKNIVASFAKGRYLIFLNAKNRIVSPDWIQEMLMYAQRSDVGVVGAKICTMDGKIQQAGMVVGLGSDGTAGCASGGCPEKDSGYMGKLWYSQDVSAVSDECMMVSKLLFDSLGGFNENFSVVCGDIDFCLRVRQKGSLVVFTPYAELRQTKVRRGKPETVAKRQALMREDAYLFRERWKNEITAGDPYYNSNLLSGR